MHRILQNAAMSFEVMNALSINGENMFTIVMGKNKAVNVASCWTLQRWRDTPQGDFFYFFHPRGRGMNFALLIDRTCDYLNSYINMPEHVYITNQQTVPRSWKSSKTFRNLLAGGLLNIHNISSKSYLSYHVIHIMSGSKTVRNLGHTNKKAGRDTRTTEPANASR